MADQSATRISFQGELGAFSHQACAEAFPEMEPLPRPTFEDAIMAVKNGEARLGMLPVDNSIYGRIADIHQMLPDSGLYIIGEHFLPVHMQLLGAPGAKLEDVTEALSLSVALGQCRRFLREHGIRPVNGPDTAGSSRLVAQAGEVSRAAIASKLAGELNGLTILAENIEDASHNTTRFIIMSRQRIEAEPGTRAITSFVFQVRNIPAALYKAMGGFATNGVNMIKLESYMTDGAFTATQFYAEIEGHPEEPPTRRALDELGYFTSALKILGCYPASELRSGRRA